MTTSEALGVLLNSYKRYYNVSTEEVAEPFSAEAVFHTHDEQYFLLRSATISEAEAHEYVFFATEDVLTPERARLLDERAWEEGMNRVKPHKNHRSTDIILVILAETVEKEAKDYLRKVKRYQSYHHTLQGWSHYSVIAMEISTGELFYNRRGKDLRKLFRNIK